jgi:long-chain acyl-CoA synthetase
MTRNLARLAEETHERRGDYDALWFEGRWYWSRHLFQRGAHLDLGVKPGERVVVMMENSPDVGAVYHAIARAGAVVTPVIFLASAEELRRILVDSKPSLVVTSPLVAETVNAVADGVRVVTDLLELRSSDPLPIVDRHDDDLAALVYTGGTTGRAKGVMLTHANLYEAGRRGHEAGHVDGIYRSLSCLPLSHSYGLLVLNVGLHHPGHPQSVLMRWFDAETWLALAQEHRSQIAPVVPSMLSMGVPEPLED